MGGCKNYDAKLAKLCMISTLFMQFPGIIMEYNRLTDQSMVGRLKINTKTGGYQKVLAISVTRYLRFC